VDCALVGFPCFFTFRIFITNFDFMPKARN